MEANMTQNTLEKNPFNNFSYWENKILNDEDLWEGYFNNKEITKTSKIVYTGIFNLEKNILQCGWVTYPCNHSLLGFLQYVFLPTSFFCWFDNKYGDDLYIPVTTFNDAVNTTLKHNNSNMNLNSVNSMKKSYDFISNLWNSNYETFDFKLKNFCDSFNNTWDNEPTQKLFLKVFNNACEIYDFIEDSITWDSKEFIEEDISITLYALKFACENAAEEPLLSRRLIDILNTNAPLLF